MSVRAGIAGLGRWGQVLVNSVRGKSDAITITAGCTGRRARAEAFCNDAGIELRDGLDDLLADPDLDAVILATPHGQHAEQIIQAAAAGKHVFVEKPFTLDKASAEAAAEACEEAGVVCALGHNRRFLPAMARLREIVAGGEIGEVLHLEANISIPGRAYEDGHWRLDPVENPAGSMTALGVHVTDALISLAGPVREVTSKSSRRTHADVVSDVTSMILEFESGATAGFATLFQTAPIWFIRVIGNAGWATMRGYQRVALRRIGDDKERLEKFDKPDIERAELEAFADAVTGKAPYPLPVADAIHGTALLEAIARSAEMGETVTL
ncbi:MAG: Gfo/Idh/MocA family oxidoreductase [Magnetovibrio sp.]|nr:Gfo/Idh/MocA family oxidoreductase [Magnetovibrio sp.]